jgi:RNA polymerase sigma-70 factor (ECF subfamily)
MPLHGARACGRETSLEERLQLVVVETAAHGLARLPRVLSEVMIGAAPRAGGRLRARRDLETVATELVARGQEAWPRIKVSPTDFVEHIGRRIDDAEDVATALAELHAADLWLAYACGRGNRAAIGELDRQLGSLVPLALARMKEKVSAEDVGQLLREKLLVGKQDREPKILEYSGRGPLGGWMRIAAVRTALSIARRGDAAGMTPVTREVLLALPTSATDPEMAHLRKRYARDFKRAFESALAELTVEDRNVLRLSLVDGLSIDEIGVVFGVHRATAARHLVRAKETVQTRTREILAERLDLGRTELRSMMAYIQSHLDLSIQRLLTPKSAEAEAPPPKKQTSSGKAKTKTKSRR